eukprot:COSAG05_NODE_2179_length_3433_cov_5.910318_4_plen_201_part_00
MNSQPSPVRRLDAVERGVASGAVILTPASSVLLRGLRGLLGSQAGAGAGDDDESKDAEETLLNAGAESDDTTTADGNTPQLPDVFGIVRGCYHRASDDERAATGWDASTGRFARERVHSITVTTDPNDPTLHPYASGDGDPDTPPERGILCQTAEAYDKLRSGLAESAALLSEERPGSAENLFLSGLTAWDGGAAGLIFA